MKYMGSKSRFYRQILDIVLADRADGQAYVEPFAGGCNVVCHVTGERLAADVNPHLIAMWQALIDGWLPPPDVSRVEYDAMRSVKSRQPDALYGWVGFNCSYSGKWWGGYAGKTSTKIGTVRDYQNEARRNVLAQIDGLRGVRLVCASYDQVAIPDRSIIYCDPPYQSTTRYDGSPDSFDHAMFWEWVRRMGDDGHTVYVSEYAAPGDFACVWQSRATSSLSANGVIGANKISTERLFLQRRIT